MTDKPNGSTTIHLRIPKVLKDAINARADAERRMFTQMAVIMLQDAALAWQLQDRAAKQGKRASNKT